LALIRELRRPDARKGLAILALSGVLVIVFLSGYRQDAAFGLLLFGFVVVTGLFWFIVGKFVELDRRPRKRA